MPHEGVTTTDFSTSGGEAGDAASDLLLVGGRGVRGGGDGAEGGDTLDWDEVAATFVERGSPSLVGGGFYIERGQLCRGGIEGGEGGE